MTDELGTGSPANRKDAAGAPAHRMDSEAPDLRVVPDGGPLSGPQVRALPDHEAWRATGLELARERRASDLEWRLGDWAAQADGEFATLAEAAAIADESLSNIKKYVATSKAFPPVRRRTGVAFFLHSEVTALPEDEGERLLDQAVAGNWTRAEMRAAVAELRDRKNADLAARNEELVALVEKLRADNKKANEQTRRARARFKAMRRAVREEVERAGMAVRDLVSPQALAGRHGNSDKGLARAAAQGFRALQADVRTARADAAHSIERIAGRRKTPVEAAVSVLMDDTEEALHEIVRRLEAAELDPEQAGAVKDAFEARMQAMSDLVKGKVRPAVKRLAGTGGSQ